MLRGTQFTITTIMGVTAIVALLLRWDIWWLLLLIVEVALVYLCVEILMRNLPTGIRKRAIDNCNRWNGSWSTNREQCEISALRKLRRNLTCIFLLVIIPTHMIIWTLQTDAIPGLLAGEFLGFSDATVTSSNSESIKHQHAEQQIQDYKIMIWLGITVWALFACWFVASGYMYLLREHAKEIILRAEEYKYRDLLTLDSGCRPHHRPHRSKFKNKANAD